MELAGQASTWTALARAVSARLGPIPLPTGLLSRIINETIRDAQVHITLTRLEIRQDRLIVAGTRS